jgi:hypothetical protein
MKIEKGILVITIFMVSGILFCQENANRHFPVNVSFVYPLGIHASRSVEYIYDFSFNALTGYNRGVNGFELGGLLNMNHGNISGCQISGLGNITHENVDGLQIAGLFSIGDNLDGLQISGIFNKCSKADGLQISGIINLSDSSEASIAGIANINTGLQNGIQIAGIYNQTQMLNGIQIGLINVADTINRGVCLGLINLIKKGSYSEGSVTVADYQNIGFSFKHGTKNLYTIYTAGMNLIKDRLWVAGLGLGQINNVNSVFSIQTEMVLYTYFPMDFKRYIRDTYVSHLKIGFVRKIDEHISFTAAPGIYLSWKSNRGRYDKYGYEQSPLNPLFDVKPAYHNTKMECGLGLSLGFSFN